MPSFEVILDRQLRRWELEKSLRAAEPGRASPLPPQPVITVSRQHGSGGSVIAESVAASFHYTLLNRDLIDRICASTGTVRRIAESLDEHAKPQVTSWLESLLGLHYVDTGGYMRALLETITSIGRLGGVVVVGRGTNFILGPDHAFHVRTVAPKEVRVERIMQRSGLGLREAQHEVDTKDRERTEFIRRTFHRDVNDPLGYDLVVNTARLPLESAVRLVVNAALSKFQAIEAHAHPELQASKH